MPELLKQVKKVFADLHNKGELADFMLPDEMSVLCLSSEIFQILQAHRLSPCYKVLCKYKMTKIKPIVFSLPDSP